MNEERIGCEFCYYDYYDGKAYPCSMCIRGEERTDKFEPKGRQTKQTEIPKKRIDKPFRAVWLDDELNEIGTPQTDCETCKYGQDKHRYAHICNECGVGINNYTPQTESLEQFRVGLEYHTDATHFGKAKGESITTDTADTPQTDLLVKTPQKSRESHEKTDTLQNERNE